MVTLAAPRVRTRTFITLSGIAAVLVLLFLGSFMLGRYPVSPSTVVSYIWQTASGQPWTGAREIAMVVGEIRLPRLAAAVMVGAALSVAGAVFQGMFRNPLVSPDLLGTAHGAGFGASLAILLGMGAVMIQASAFVFGLVAVLASWTLSQRMKRDRTLGLVLAGIVVGSLFVAGTSVIKYVADTDKVLPEITFWLMGGLAGLRGRDLPSLVIPLVICTSVLWLLRWRLNVLAVGDETATTLGINVRLLQAIVIVCATFLTTAAVSIAGMVAWVGLLIPHLARLIFGPDFRVLLPASFLIGACFMLIVDNIARNLLPAEIPLSILTALVGAPFLAALLIREREW